jgi:hypothetical protein
MTATCGKQDDVYRVLQLARHARERPFAQEFHARFAHATRFRHASLTLAQPFTRRTRPFVGK